MLALLDPSFQRRLDAFTARLSHIREAEGRRLLDPAIYEQLPFAPTLRKSHEWRIRRYGLEIVRKRLRRRERLRILDVGAWNGWLSHQLATLGHDLTAVDYFADEYDGLGARKFYRSNWRAIQLDLTDIAVLDQRYDLVVLNHCLAFFGDPHALVAAARRLVAPSGSLVLIGLELFRAPAVKAAYVAELKRRYLERYGFDLFFMPTKGYLDFADRARLEAQGLKLRPYPRLCPANLKARLKPSLPWHAYAVWSQSST